MMLFYQILVSRATFYFYVILREPCDRRISWNFQEILRLLALAVNGYGIRLSPSARAPQDDVLLLRHSEGECPKNLLLLPCHSEESAATEESNGILWGSFALSQNDT